MSFFLIFFTFFYWPSVSPCARPWSLAVPACSWFVPSRCVPGLSPVDVDVDAEVDASGRRRRRRDKCLDILLQGQAKGRT